MYGNRILRALGKAEAEDLERIEQKFQVKIPAAVREHYLAYNGGYPEKPVFTDKSGNAYIVGWFIPVYGEKKLSVEKMLRLLREDEAIPNWLIPFADEDGGNLFCFSVRDYPLEDMAVKKIGDDAIDDAFETVSAAIGDTVWEMFGEFIGRQRLGDELAVCDELFDNIKRDMAWACVEKILDITFGDEGEQYTPKHLLPNVISMEGEMS